LTLTNVNGTVETYYALLSWREIYSMYLFPSKSDRDAFLNLSIEELEASDEQPTLAFIQDFGNGAPEEQCVYFGSFTTPIGVSDGQSGTLGRNVEGVWSVGDILTEVEAPMNGNCPEGYPNVWGDFTPPPDCWNCGPLTSSAMTCHRGKMAEFTIVLAAIFVAANFMFW
jgi:hypothetical protein